jgi:hypothetical protein
MIALPAERRVGGVPQLAAGVVYDFAFMRIQLWPFIEMNILGISSRHTTVVGFPNLLTLIRYYTRRRQKRNRDQRKSLHLEDIVQRKFLHNCYRGRIWSLSGLQL